VWVANEGFQTVAEIPKKDTVIREVQQEKPTLPSYLVNVPSDYSQNVLDVFKTEPATLDTLSVSQELTPAEQQGRAALQTVKAPAPASGTVEPFFAGPSPAPSAPSETPTSCAMEYNPDPNGENMLICKTTDITGKTQTYSGLPKDMKLPDWLKSMATKDMSSEDMEYMNLWLKKQGIQSNMIDFSNYVKLQAKKENKEALKKDEKTEEKKTGVSSSSACKPKKPTCEPKKPVCPVHIEPIKGCPKCPDMRDYVRKDSIPCWACKL
jgi:hypothetical protein